MGVEDESKQGTERTYQNYFWEIEGEELVRVLPFVDDTQ